MVLATGSLRWFRWSYVPLVLSGLLPFWVGTLLARVNGFPWRAPVAGWASLGVILVILAAFWIKELHDPENDRQPLTEKIASLSPDVPGWLQGAVSVVTLKKMSWGAVATAAAVGWLLQFYFHTGSWTILLGVLGLLGGYAYAALPAHWRAWGAREAIAALCFGPLPVTAGFYVQSSSLVSELFLFALPLSFSSLNVCLSKSFLDYQADRRAGKPSLTVHLDLVGGAFIYTLANIITIIGLVGCILFPAASLPYHQGLWGIILLAVINQEMVKRKQYKEHRGQLILWGLTIGVNLGMAAWFLVMIWGRL